MRGACGRGIITVSEIPLVAERSRSRGVIRKIDGRGSPAFDGWGMGEVRINPTIDDHVIRYCKSFYTTLVVCHFECHSEGTTIGINVYRVL